MGVSVYLPDAKFSEVVASINPEPVGLEGLFFTKVNQATSIDNSAFGKPDASAVGALTYTSQSALNLNASNYFDSGVSISGDCTLLCLCKAPTGSSRIMGNLLDGTPVTGDMIDFTSSTRTMRAFNSGVSSSLVIPSDYVADDFRIFAASFRNNGDGTSLTRLFVSDRDAILSGSSQFSSARAPVPSRNIRLGAVYSGVPSNREVAAFGVWSRALSFAEIVNVYRHLKASYGSAITIS